MGQVGMRAAGDIAGTMGTPEFATMLQLGSAAIGAAVGEGSGAAAALAGTQYNYLTHLQLETLDKQISQCKGDAVCIQTAKSDAEMLSARQEQDLIHGCNAAGVYCASNYANGINDAINYINDPLAAKLGLQVDQSITAQNYANYQSQWGLVYGDKVASQNGEWSLLRRRLALVPPPLSRLGLLRWHGDKMHGRLIGLLPKGIRWGRLRGRGL